jgi:YfiH family protein
MMPMRPTLTCEETRGMRVWTDPALAADAGVRIAFTERAGGRSAAPYAGLNLAAHVGDHVVAVDENRSGLIDALGLDAMRARLTTAEQVHGLTVREVSGATVGMGAYAHAGGAPPVPSADALFTTVPDAPLMLLFADCVPVVLVAPGLVRGVAVVHAGWKGALGRLPGKAASALAAACSASTADILAYVGPHIGPCHYEVDADRLSRFVDAFGTIAAARGGLDLGAVVSESLREVGVPEGNVVASAMCTAEATDRFFSFRAEGVTGRHAALAVVLGPVR